jgi:hypothetical protein
MNNIITTNAHKLTFSVCLLLLLTTLSFGQTTDNWYFGSPTVPNMGLRLDFSAGGTPVVTRGYPLATEEGSSSISDANGNPLFYTDGQKIWDASTNATFGTGLLGGQSATQSAIVMPKPGSTNQWLVFTSGQTAGVSGTNGINYYTVTGTGSPGVSPFTISAATNLAGTNVVGEGLFIIGSTKAGSKFWVIARESGTANGTSGKVRAWDVSNAGVVTAAPVISTLSNAGWVQTNFASNIGTIKSNTCQNQLAFSYLNGDVDLTDFDTQTGMVKANTAKRITGASIAGGNAGSYGLEFSPNDKYLYFTDLAGKSVFRFDTTAAGGAAVQMANSPVTYEAGQLQLGPDGNIYMAMVGDGHLGNGYLGIISSPNTGGSLTENGLLVTTNANPNGFCYRGLPTFPKTLVVSNPTISPNDTTICQNGSINFKYGSYAGSTSTIAWDFGDPGSGAANTSTSVAPSHTFNSLGIFKVKVTITDLCSRIWKDSINVTVVAPKVPTGTVGCGTNSLTLTATGSVAGDYPNYIWYKNSVATANIIGTGASATYTAGNNSALPTQICVGVSSTAPVTTTGSSSIGAYALSGASELTPKVSSTFDVLSSQLLLKSFNIGFRFAGTHPNITVTIKNGSGTVVYSNTLTITQATGGTNAPVTVNTTLPKGTGYTITIGAPSTEELQRGTWSGATNAGQITYNGSGVGTDAISNLQYDWYNYTVTPTCSTPACYTVSCTLPVKLIGFTGSAVQNSVFLNWITASELNNDYFDIQRSTDGINFISIGTVKGNGNSSTINEYAFQDINPANGINYYKLIQHDFNGEVSISTIVKVSTGINDVSFTVSPNPSAESFNINFKDVSGGEFTVLNVLGQMLTHKVVESGTEKISVGAELAKGAYVLRFSGTNGVYTQLVIKE